MGFVSKDVKMQFPDNFTARLIGSVWVRYSGGLLSPTPTVTSVGADMWKEVIVSLHLFP